MKIAVKKAGPNAFALAIGDAEVALDAAALKTLLLEITRVLAPGADMAMSEEDRARAFMQRLAGANDLGIQKLLLASRHDDVLVLLKAAENDKSLPRRIYGNMSERSRKIFAEDLVFKFPEGLPPGRLRQAIESLTRTARDLETDGTLIFEKTAAAKGAPS